MTNNTVNVLLLLSVSLMVFAFESLQVFPMDPPNDTDPDETIARVQQNDQKLTDLNWNNIKVSTYKKKFFVFCSNGINVTLPRLGCASLTLALESTS